MLVEWSSTHIGVAVVGRLCCWWLCCIVVHFLCVNGLAKEEHNNIVAKVKECAQEQISHSAERQLKQGVLRSTEDEKGERIHREIAQRTEDKGV